MRPGRRLVTLATAMAVAILPSASAPQAVAQSPPPDADDPSSESERGEEIVHSWALAPAGSTETGGAGNRPNLSYVANPGDVINDAVTLYNFGNVPLTFHVYATDAFNNSDGEFSLLAGDQSPADVGVWVDLPTEAEQVTVLPGHEARIPFSLTVPRDASPGDHTGAVLASSPALSDSSGGQVLTVDRRTGPRLFVRVNGPLRAELAIEDLSADYSPALDPLDGSMSVSFLIKNRGNVRLGGSYELSVAGPFGIGRKRLAAADFPELLPGQAIEINAVVDDVPALLTATTSVTVEPAPDGEGITVAPSSRSVTTLAAPVGVLLLVLLALLAGLGRRAYRRHRAAAGKLDYEVIMPSPSAESQSEPQLT